ncbi:MAG: hypothetical protein ACI94D_002717, partial [Neolewinella sp.]
PAGEDPAPSSAITAKMDSAMMNFSPSALYGAKTGATTSVASTD